MQLHDGSQDLYNQRTEQHTQGAGAGTRAEAAGVTEVGAKTE